MAPPAFKAAFSDFKLVKTRKVAQLIFEVPVEGADAALQTLGGLPRSDAEVWCGIARLAPEKPATASRNANGGDAKERRPFKELPFPQQAALRCADLEFQQFLGVGSADRAADRVRDRCGVPSRSEIRPETSAGILWERLNAEFTAWRHEAPIAEPVR